MSGVIARDFLATGMADILVDKFQGDLVADWKSSLVREQKVGFYVHPAGLSFYLSGSDVGLFCAGN